MKKFFAFITCSLIGIVSFAQISSSSSSMPSALGKIADADDLFIVSLTSDNWLKLSSALESKPLRSRGFSFLILKEKMNTSGHVGIGYGLGFSSQNVHTNGAIGYDEAAGRNYLTKVPDANELETNKLSLNFIDVALELRLRTSENTKGKSWKLSAGMKGGILVQNHIKYEDKYGKYKSYNIKGLNNFQYGVTGRFGYGKVAVSTYYSLVDVFKKDKGPELTPFSLGISFTF